MAWYNPFSWASVTGIDLDAEAERTRELNERKEAMDQAAYKRGIWTPEDLQFVHQQRMSDAEAWNPDRYNAEVAQAAAEGARDGLVEIQGAVKDAATSAAGFTLRGVFGFVPWWLWIVGLGVAAWYLGAFRGILKRA